LIIQATSGKSKVQSLQYTQTEGDEVEDLEVLLREVQRLFPEVEAVSSGAIFSTYQRNRVEHVCGRLNLMSVGYLWQKEQHSLLGEMVDSGVEAILIKVAAMGLEADDHLGKTIAELTPHFRKLHSKFQFHVCGEGGEYETLVLDCPLFKRKKVALKRTTVHIPDDDQGGGTVGILVIEEAEIVDKPNPLTASVATSSLATATVPVSPPPQPKLYVVCPDKVASFFLPEVYASDDGLHLHTEGHTSGYRYVSPFEHLIRTLGGGEGHFLSARP
jgi:diphthine-ammonia ligase